MALQVITKEDVGYGPHLVLEGYGGNKNKLNDIVLIRNFLDQCPARIGMTKISKPFIMKYNHPTNSEDSGITGFVIIAESHISIHTYPYKNFLVCDVFSCKEFDAERCVEFVKDTFEIKELKAQLLKRGEKFPRTPNHLFLQA